MDIILEGLPEEYNAFVMMESMLFVQEAQLEIFYQELSSPAPSANALHTSAQPGPQANAFTALGSTQQFRSSYYS